MSLYYNIRSLVLLIVITLFSIACDVEDPYQTDYSFVPDPFTIDESTKVETESGLTYYVVEEGSSEHEISRREIAQIHYTIRRSNLEILDSSYINGNFTPRQYRFPTFDPRHIITVPGLREGILGMKKGEKRVFIVPPKLAFESYETHELRNDTLRFDVELVNIVY